MKRQIFLKASLLLVAGMLAACSSNDNENNGTKDGKVDVAKAVEFRVDFADYNADEETKATRATDDQKNDTIAKQYVDLGNNLLAEVTVQRDTAKTPSLTNTRALENGTYTMLAYQGSTYKGEVTGTITGGVFHYSSDKVIDLEPGTYDFVLLNDKLTRNGNNFTVAEADAQTALIGRTTYTVTATPTHQKVTFQMKHVSSRIRLKWTSYTSIVNPVGDFWANGIIPHTSVYHPETNTWTVATTDSGPYGPMTYTGGNTADENDIYSTISNYLYFLAPAEKSDMHFNLGNTQSKTYNGQIINFILSFLNLPNASSIDLKPNSSYLITYKLMYNFLYLMSDGSTGFLNETIYGSGSKTPIAIVLSQSKHMAIALKDANGGNLAEWGPYFVQSNTHMVMNLADALNSSATSGYDETWDASYSTHAVTGEKIKGKNPDFPAFYAAAHYDPGIAYTGTPALQWYLPSASDWTWVYSVLGFSDKTKITDIGYFPCHSRLIDIAFTQVGGKFLKDFGGALLAPNYWSSTEYHTSRAFKCSGAIDYMNWLEESKDIHLSVRAFVKY